jgi:hypothetical protein
MHRRCPFPKARLEGGDTVAYELLSDINVVMYQMSGEKKYLVTAREYIDKAESEGIKLSTKRFAILLGMGDHAAARKLVDNETDEQTKLFLESLLLLEQQDIDAARKSLEKLIAMQPQASGTEHPAPEPRRRICPHLAQRQAGAS